MMRVVPSTDTVPASLNKYLLPNERHVISVRQHPAVLILPIFYVLVGLAIAGWLSNSIAHGTAVLIIWGLWLVLLLWLLLDKIAEWMVHYFAVTSQRLMVAQGLVVRKVNMIPLGKVTDIEFRRTTTGRILGYGEFEVIAPGMPDDKLRFIKFIPYSEQLYLEICGLMFMGKEDND